MLWKTLMILAALTTLVSAAGAEHRLYGEISYQGCECAGGAISDQVVIESMTGRFITLLPVICRSGKAYYDTGAAGLPAGRYRLRLRLNVASDCVRSEAVVIQHGTEDQRVDLIVYGPTPKPDGGDK